MSSIIKLFLFASLFLNGEAQSSSCTDKTDEPFQIGRKASFRKNCRQIKNKYPHLCNFKPKVQENCAFSCALCGGRSNDDICKDVSTPITLAKGTVWEKERSCKHAERNQGKFCGKSKIKKFCPVACDFCTPRYEKCNGLASNCGMPANELLWPTIHNANHDDAFFSNHLAPLEDALEAGYRGLFLDVCKCNGQIEFCHGICGIGDRKVTTVFENISYFLDNNPMDVIIINFEISANNPTPKELWDVMASVNGIADRTYQHGGGRWPTLGDLIDDNKQIIAFQHNGPNCPSGQGCVPEILDFFDYTMGTHWDFGSISELEDTSDSCRIVRGQSGADFYSVNTFVTTAFGPSRSAADTINEEDFLKQRISACESVINSKPNFVSIDFWQRGDLVKVALEENAIRAG